MEGVHRNLYYRKMSEPDLTPLMKNSGPIPGWRTGAHISSAGGILKAFERLKAIGGDCLQVFSASPRIWNRLSIQETADGIAVPGGCGGIPVFIHAAYLVNLTSENPAVREKSVESLVRDLYFNAALKGMGVIVHPGCSRNPDRKSALTDLVRMTAGILESSPPESRFIIENSAGQEGRIGSDLSEVRFLLSELQDARVGWCFDTCHGFASGYRFSPAAYPVAVKLDRGLLETELDRHDLRNSLACIHVNDSRDPFGSGRDRHENLGNGMIPVRELSSFFNNSGCRNVPLILEVPGIAGNGPDRENLEFLRSLIS